MVPVIDVTAGRPTLADAWRDIRDGVGASRIIWTLVRRENRDRYGGILMSAVWVSLTTLALVVGLGLLYSQLFSADAARHVGHVAGGIVAWGLISALVTEGSHVFVGGSGAFKEARLPYALFAARHVVSATLIFAFRLVVAIGVLAVAGRADWAAAPLALLGLAVTLWAGFWATLLVGLLHARFRDVAPSMNAILTFMFFATPVFWRADQLGELQRYLVFNPFHHFVEIIRGPLMGEPGFGLHFGIAAGLAAVLTVVSFLVYARLFRRLPYWC